MIIDESKKTITINKDIRYNDCLALEKFYQGYIVNVNGNVDINGQGQNLKQLPKILFNEISGYFKCSFNQLISLEYCPKKIGSSFYCSNNQLTSLKYCPREVGDDFYCYDNLGEFTKEDVEEYCKVEKEIYC